MKDNSIIFMFAGQGSQYYHMGKELYKQNEYFRNSMQSLDNHIQQKIGKSVIEVLYNPENRTGTPFDNTLYTHLAIFMVEYSLATSLQKMGVYPDVLLGVSLGEFTIAALSEALEYHEVLDCLIEHALCTEKSSIKGSMLAVLASPTLYENTSLLHNNSEIASINYHEHFVLTGAKKSLTQIADYLKSESILYQMLPVSFAFHSSLMEPLKESYLNFLKNISFSAPKIECVSALYGDFIKEFSSHHFWNVGREKMLFQESVQKLEESSSKLNYIDLSPGGTLAGFVKNNLSDNSDSDFFSIMSPFHQDYKKILQCVNQYSFN